MSKKNIFDLLDVPEDIGGEISENCPKIDTDRTEALIRSAIGGTGAAQAPAKKRPLRRRFMIGLVAAVVSAAVIGGAVAVVAQNNGQKVETVSEDTSVNSDVIYKLDAQRYKELYNEIKDEAFEKADQRFLEENGYKYSDYYNEYRAKVKAGTTQAESFDNSAYGLYMRYMAEALDEQYIELLNRAVDSGYGTDDLRINGEEDKAYLADAEGSVDDPESKRKVLGRIETICKALNDPDFSLTEKERCVLYHSLNDVYSAIRQYASIHT